MTIHLSEPRPAPILLPLLAAICAALAVAGCGGDSRGGGPPWGGGGGRPPAVVETATVETGPYAVAADFVGTLEAKVSAELYARTSGQIVAVYADAGDRVRSGQLLARLDPADATREVERATAALRVAEATISQREADLEVAEATARRTGTLFSQDLVPQQDQDAVQAELTGARAQLELARAQVAQARAALGTARLELEKTRVVAPFDGWVGKRFIDRGDLATTNRPIFSIVDLETIVTRVDLTDRDVARVAPGQEATVAVGAYPGETFDGRVARIASVFDPETNTIEAEVAVDNRGGLLKPGMLAEVSIAYGTEPSALLVPASAVVEGERDAAIFVAERAPAAGTGGSGDRSRGGRPGSEAAAQSGGRPGAGGPPGTGDAGPSWIARRVPVELLGTGADGRRAVAPLGGGRPAAAGGPALSAGDRVIVLGQDALSGGEPVVVSDGGPPAGAEMAETRGATR